MNVIERDDAGNVTEESQADVFDVKVGDCMSESADDVVSEVPLVPCSEAHDEEIFGEFELSGTEYPGEEAIEQESDEKCIAMFNDFVGIDYLESELDFYTLSPTKEGWDILDDRIVNCVVYDPAGQVTGTLAGAGR